MKFKIRRSEIVFILLFVIILLLPFIGNNITGYVVEQVYNFGVPNPEIVNRPIDSIILGSELEIITSTSTSTSSTTVNSSFGLLSEKNYFYIATNSADTCTSGDENTTCYINLSYNVDNSSNLKYGVLIIQNLGNLVGEQGGDFFTINASNITIKTGGTINGNVVIESSNLTIDLGGKIDVTKKGYGVSQGPCFGGVGTGGCYGGGGGSNKKNVYGNLTSPTHFGSSGDTGLAGGAIKLNVSNVLVVNGQILADGEDKNAATGSGGSIYIIANNISGTGNISAKGGDTTNGGGPSGGRIAVYYTLNSFTGNLSVKGGTGTSGGHGGAGTIFKKSSAQTYGELILDNYGITGQKTTLNSTFEFDNLTLRNKANFILNLSGNLTIHNINFEVDNATFTQDGAFNAPNLNNLTINGDLQLSANYSFNNSMVIHTTRYGTLISNVNNDTKLYFINLSATNITIDLGGSINVSGRGYGVLQGPCYGGVGTGGCYGGKGGVNKKEVYGNLTSPTDLGSSGDTGLSGGLVMLNVSNRLLVNGEILANGDNINAATGSGGSIYIIANNISGTGNISARGGVSTNGGGGGGGRAAIYYNIVNFNGNLSVRGGTGTTGDGGAGTIFKKSSAQTYGELILDNGGVVGSDTIINSTFEFDNLTLMDKASFNLSLAGNLTIHNTNFIINNATFTQDGAFNAPNLNNLTINGDLQLSANYSFNNSMVVHITNRGRLFTRLNGATQIYFINLSATNITIDLGGSINVSGRGYGVLQGPCYGGVGTGGCYGGKGSLNNISIYGSITSPTDLGSAGDTGVGGGAIKLNISNVLLVNGEILANGDNLNDATGSGGSIYIIANNISGTGNISAKGGVSTSASGSGGRIALYSVIISSFTGNLVNLGASGSENGTTFICNTLNGIDCRGIGGSSKVVLNSSGISLVTFYSINRSLDINKTVIQSWNTSSLRWNDSSSNSSVIAIYNITGLGVSTYYTITNNSQAISDSPLVTDASGTLPEFNITLSSPHEIIVASVSKGYFPLYLTNTTGTELNKNITILTNQTLNITSKDLTPADANITLFITNYTGGNFSANISKSFLQNFTTFWTDGSFLINISWEGNLTMSGNSTAFYVDVGVTTTSTTTTTSSTSTSSTTTSSTVASGGGIGGDSGGSGGTETKSEEEPVVEEPKVFPPPTIDLEPIKPKETSEGDFYGNIKATREELRILKVLQEKIKVESYPEEIKELKILRYENTLYILIGDFILIIDLDKPAYKIKILENAWPTVKEAIDQVNREANKKIDEVKEGYKKNVKEINNWFNNERKEAYYLLREKLKEINNEAIKEANEEKIKYKEEINKINNEYKNEINEFKKEREKELKETSNQFKEKINLINQDYKEQVKEANIERDEKIKDVKETYKENVEEIRNEENEQRKEVYDEYSNKVKELVNDRNNRIKEASLKRDEKINQINKEKEEKIKEIQEKGVVSGDVREIIERIEKEREEKINNLNLDYKKEVNKIYVETKQEVYSVYYERDEKFKELKKEVKQKIETESNILSDETNKINNEYKNEINELSKNRNDRVNEARVYLKESINEINKEYKNSINTAKETRDNKLKTEKESYKGKLSEIEEEKKDKIKEEKELFNDYLRNLVEEKSLLVKASGKGLKEKINQINKEKEEKINKIKEEGTYTKPEEQQITTVGESGRPGKIRAYETIANITNISGISLGSEARNITSLDETRIERTEITEKEEISYEDYYKLVLFIIIILMLLWVQYKKRKLDVLSLFLAVIYGIFTLILLCLVLTNYFVFGNISGLVIIIYQVFLLADYDKYEKSLEGLYLKIKDEIKNKLINYKKKLENLNKLIKKKKIKGKLIEHIPSHYIKTKVLHISKKKRKRLLILFYFVVGLISFNISLYLGLTLEKDVYIYGFLGFVYSVLMIILFLPFVYKIIRSVLKIFRGKSGK